MSNPAAEPVKRHDHQKCIRDANRALAPSNTRVRTEMAIDMNTGRTYEMLMVPTEKVNKHGKPAQKLVASFCPFCGVNLT